MSKQRRKITPEVTNDGASAQEKIIEQLKSAKVSKPSSQSEKATVRVTLDIPKGLHKKIKDHTKARGQTIKGYLLFLASQDIEK